LGGWSINKEWLKFMLSWLNRVGIILNFLAGFLLAPELIGIDRINKAEVSLENYIKRLEARILSTLEKIGFKTKDKKDEFLAVLIFGSAVIAMFLIIYWLSSKYGILQGIATFLGALAFTILALTWFYRKMFTENKGKSTKKFTAIIYGGIAVFAAFWLGIFFILQGFLKLIIQTPVYGILILAKSVLRFISNKLAGNDRLRSMMVTLGILLFIIGNLLQLWATF